MKRVFLSLVYLLFYISSANASIVAKANSWQMVGFGVDINLSKIYYPPKDNFSIIWMYDSNTQSWKAFSKNDNFKNIIKEKGLWRDTLKGGDAFWIQAKQDTGFLTYKPALEKLPTTKGWHLLSFGNGWWNIEKYFESFYQLQGAFVYRDNKWRYLYRTSPSEYLGYLKHFDEGEGGWIYLDNDINTTNSSWNDYPIYSDKWNNNNGSFTFANKKVTFSNGIEIILDQNGSISTNDTNLSEYSKWSVSYNGEWNKKIKIHNSDYTKEIKFYLTKDWQNNGYKLQGYRYENRKYYSNHAMDIIDINYTDENNANINVTFSDYNKSHIINSTVKTAMDSLGDLLENGSEDAATVLSTAKNNLQSINDNDAKVALAVINLIETLDDPVVKSIFRIDANDFTLSGFFKPIVYNADQDDILGLQSSLSDYSGNAKKLLNMLANRLVSSANELEPIYQDKNYVFDYKALGGDKLNYVDIKSLRAAMMAVAFKLQFYASYDLGSDEWVKVSTDGSYEYRKISADPVGFLNSGTFMVNPDQTSLTKAKNDLISFLTIYQELLNAPRNQREGTLLPHNKITYRNDKRDCLLLLKNLTDNTNYPYFVFRNENIVNEYSTYESKVEKETFIVNVNALFDAAKTVTINDFPPFEYKPQGNEGEYDAATSKQYNDGVDSNGNTLSFGTKDDYTYTQTNHINNIFIKYIDEDGQSYTGVALLNKLFE